MTWPIWEMIGETTANTDGTRDYVRKFLILTGFDADPVSVRAYPGVSQFDFYPYDDTAYAKEITATPVDQVHWEVSIKYKTEIQRDKKRQSQSQDKPPNERIPQITTSSVKRQQVLEYDLDGDVVENAAGMRFDKMPEIPRSNTLFTITWTQAERPDLTWVDWVNTVEYLGKPVGTLRINDLQTRPTEEQGATWIQCTLVIEYNYGDTTWNPILVANVGAWAYNDSDELVPNCAPDGSHISMPQKLDTDGRLIDPSSPMVYLPFRGYNRSDFNDLLADPVAYL